MLAYASNAAIFIVCNDVVNTSKPLYCNRSGSSFGLSKGLMEFEDLSSNYSKREKIST